MSMPKQGTATYKIAEILCKVGPKKYEEIAVCMSAYWMSNKALTRALIRMKEHGWLNYKDKTYSLTSEVLQFFGVEKAPEVVPPRTSSEKRSLSSQYIPSLNPLLAGRFRTDVEFKNGSVGFYAGYSTSGGLSVRG